MQKRLFSFIALMLCLVVPATAAFKNIKIDLTNGNLLTAEEVAGQTSVTFGVLIADDGAATRVAADDANANIVLTGKFHSDEHGWGNFSSTVKVEGPVKIGMGSCAWGGDVTVKNAAGETVAAFNTNNGACFHNDKEANIVYGVYKGTEATTLTISGGSYTPFLSVVTATAEDLKTDYEVTFSLGVATDVQGVLPAALKVEDGKTFVVPANFTLYKEGHTLTAWTDGTNSYKPGEEVTVTSALALTPVFTANTVSLADRDAETTIVFEFQRKNGAPTVAYQNQVGVWVAQAVVKGQSIDVKADFDTNNGGKFANGSWNDWAQLNGGTKFAIPSCKGAVVSIEAYATITTTTIDGQTDYTQGNIITYTIANTAETIDVVIGDGSYYRYIKVTLPVVESKPAGKTYTNEPAKVVWDFNSGTDYDKVSAVVPSDAFSTTAFNLGTAEVVGSGTGQAKDAAGNSVTFVKIKPANGATDYVEWTIKPVKGLTFTPTKVSGYIARFGTDSENGITISGVVDETTVVDLGNFTAPRNNKSQSEDKFGSSSNYTNQFVIELTAEQQARLATTGNFTLRGTVGVSNAKEGGYSDIHIEGIINGTIEDVAKYTLAANASPAEAAQVALYPKSDEYEEGTEVKVTAAKNFGYKFVNWTDASGAVVSEEAQFMYTVNANAELTANFEKLNTYELDYGVAGGANLYMVTPTPAPTVVDGKNMYEEGISVLLSAASNKILTFTDWSTGETSTEITMLMDKDQSVTANYAAVDFLAAWDFYKKGGDGRVADFHSADNDAAALVMRNAEGTTSGWLDKSWESAGGYEGRNAAVNWRTTGLGDFYWQTTVNAEAFTDIKVLSSMAYNYNAYQKYDVQYSLDGETWETIGSFNIPGVKNWIDTEFALPAAANNQKAVHIRWIADKTSTTDGTKSDNDGICIADIYILGTAKLINDGKAPVLLSSVPANGSTNASANGKIVLTFDEKVKVAEGAKADLSGILLSPVVSGKTVMFEYKGLSYSTDYTFTLPANSISDLTDNAIAEAVTIQFATKTRPTIAKALYDFVVPIDGTFVEALEAAAKREDVSKRFRIFVLEGDYQIPAKSTTIAGADGKQYPDPITYFNSPNVSIIGEDMYNTTITNTVPEVSSGTANPIEGLRTATVLRLEGNAKNTYFQDIMLKSGLKDACGRGAALSDGSHKTICKDVYLYGYQDTYLSDNNSSRFYFEGGVLRGRTDFLCGKGDVFYNAVELLIVDGGYICAPSMPTKYGYVFNECIIKGEHDGLDGNYTLGRPWGSGTPGARYINTVMHIKPSAVGWAEMSGGWPMRFAEYNSMTETGTVIDLSNRKKTFGDGHANNPVLTAAEAAELTLANVMGSNDDWDPTSYTEQASAPTNVKLEGNALSWDNNDYVLLWAVCKDGKVVDFTIEPIYTVDDVKAVWSVRAANEMGGLGDAATVGVGVPDALESVQETVVSEEFFTVSGLRVDASFKGMLIKVQTLSNGQKVSSKVINR